ncbi:PLC-like phosphodiesterase [Geopyxis carbonaria]|nr:PLC-like phosphodiesterase [Geopyxis carbonaria]
MFASTRPRWLNRSPSSSGPPPRARYKRIFISIVFFIFTFVCLTKVISLLLSLSTAVWSHDLQTVLRTWGLDPAMIYRTSYPTAFTRDIHPRPIHSHNDYWRQVPLYSGLSMGAIGTEADVWEYDGELFVGHDVASLTRNRTFRSLYVNPIREILDGMNRGNPILNTSADGERLRGVFDTDAEQTLHFYVDIKTPGAATLPVVLEHLEPLRTPRNYLTTWNGTHVVPGPVTVHLTGETPFDLMVANRTYRDYFYDAPLVAIADGDPRFNSTNSLMSSTPFGRDVGKIFWGGGGVSPDMLKTVRKHIKAAHDRGIGVRYWSTPGWPISVRNEVWHTLVAEGVDLLNVDDLRGAAMMEW